MYLWFYLSKSFQNLEEMDRHEMANIFCNRAYFQCFINLNTELYQNYTNIQTHPLELQGHKCTHKMF